MKVLFVHNKYQEKGGEDAVLDAEMNLLNGHSHQVFLAQQDNNIINSSFSRVNTFLNVTYSSKYRKWMSDELRKHEPDIVHVHNFFPLLSPSIYDACTDFNVPVVQTLHNYRLICPGALLMREGRICEKCIRGSAYQSVRHGCYKGSLVGTFAVAKMVEAHRKQKTWNNKVNVFIALTEFARAKFIDAGFPASNIRVKPNFTIDTPSTYGLETENRRGALFVGRLSQEKGINVLIDAWKDVDIPLRVAGEGPLKSAFLGLDSGFIKPLGMLDENAVSREMRAAAFLVMPSEWYEGFPMVLVEAFSLGLPVVTSRLGGMAEIVEDGVTGLHFEAGNANDLAQKVAWMHNHPKDVLAMGLNARSVYERKYTPEKNYELLINIYQQAIGGFEANRV